MPGGVIIREQELIIRSRVPRPFELPSHLYYSQLHSELTLFAHRRLARIQIVSACDRMLDGRGKSRKPPSQVNPTARKAWRVRGAGSSPSPVSQHVFLNQNKTGPYKAHRALPKGIPPPILQPVIEFLFKL
ncbi:hypothetical protein NC653_011939 [Populus alba x Populus x berolinensis]|uniref:Uncharacterized protein n=1 Tax=Populus alba x Populus x berolinensis TaxID=444605 RepID=A0AAD6R3H7_9ROSI|nr:hypothetical protein NC653_011939 [Populus alba x Populus x berolinensis]